MNRHARAIALLASVMALAAACSGKQSMASRSAAAYDEAQKKGGVVGAGEHGGHDAGTEEANPGDMAGMDHSTMSGADQSQTAGMDHSKLTGMDHTQMTGLDHSKMTKTDHSTMTGTDYMKMAGMDHTQLAGMDHSSMAGMQHGASGAPAAPAVVVEAPRSSAEMARLTPATTMQTDEFDAPAPIAVSESSKTSGGGRLMKTPAAPHQHTTSAASDDADVYACPMHPEVTSASPGACPKCGMTLVKKK